jgi:hypothetical protein
MEVYGTMFEAEEAKTELERQHGNAQFEILMNESGTAFVVVDVMERFRLPARKWVGVADQCGSGGSWVEPK